jgi:hypothetical protein
MDATSLCIAGCRLPRAPDEGLEASRDLGLHFLCEGLRPVAVILYAGVHLKCRFAFARPDHKTDATAKAIIKTGMAAQLSEGQTFMELKQLGASEPVSNKRRHIIGCEVNGPLSMTVEVLSGLVLVPLYPAPDTRIAVLEASGERSQT